MKNQIILAIYLCLFSSLTFGQAVPLDNQWLVIDGTGKSGYNTGTKQNIYANLADKKKIKLSKVFQPALAVPPAPQLAMNDIFVIYEDGNYFNSRDHNAVNFIPNFFLPTVGSAPDSIHNLQTNYTRNITSMYLTNVYEEDDLPANVRAANWSTGETPDITFTNSIPSQIITANHDVVLNKDITLIINNSITAGLVSGDSLITNMIIYGSGTPVTKKFFTVSRVFSNKAEFSNKPGLGVANNGNIGLGSITPNNPPYIFVNLRPTSELLPYVGMARANFSLKRQGQMVPFSSLVEDVASAHDPNFTEVLSTCQRSDGEKYIFYHIEFENDGRVSAEEVKINIKFPKYLNENCISDTAFYIAGERVSGKVHKFLGVTKFIFDPDVQVSPCVTPDATLCSGYVEFWIKIDESKDLRSFRNTILELKNAEVKFHGLPAEKISTFEDLESVDETDPTTGDNLRKAPITDCSCSCH